MHLALGEWIVKQRAVPFFEPFAWTRDGAPYYSYSWAAQVLFYALAEAGGKLPLRMLHGFMLAGAGASMLYLGRSARWDPRTSVIMAAINVAILNALVASVRPQALLFTLVPLAWAFNYGAVDAKRPLLPLVGLAIVCAAAANTHIFFPLTAVPWFLWLANPPANKSRVYAIVAVTVGAWFVSPYALVWHDVYRLNATPNALLSYPSPINETIPGFLAIAQNVVAVSIGIGLALLPWLRNAPGATPRSVRAQFVFAVVWAIGLVAFSSALRLLLIWWMCLLPVAAAAIARASDKLLASETQYVRLLRITAVWSVCAALLLSPGRFESEAWAVEDPAGLRTLHPMHESGLEHVARWLQCSTNENASGRVFTYFDYGSPLTWRLPGYSMSIDGRTIFPDSVAKPEAFYDLFKEPLREGPWRSADLAIIPAGGSVAKLLDSAAGWRRVAIAHRESGSVALWVTDAWWARAGKVPLPPHSIPIANTYACASNNSVPR